MIGQILPRGSSVRGLLYYLFTEGLAGEKGLEAAHTDPRVIASWDGQPDRLQPPVCGGRRDFTDVVSRLSEPLSLLGMSKAELKAIKPVYHLTIAAAKDAGTGALVDRYLSDAQWADIAAEYMDRIGLATRGERTGVRWIAVRHADDHVHVVATLARQDAERPRPRLSNDRFRSREASRIVEDRYGLTTTSPASRTGVPATSRAEQRKHQDAVRRQRGQGGPAPAGPDREVLRRQVRTAAAGASGLEEFFDRLQADGLLVRQRMSERNPGEVTGYAVALPDRQDGAGRPVWFGGGKLASDLTLPRLQRRWHDDDAGRSRPAHEGQQRTASTAGARAGSSSPTDRFGLTEFERRRIWTQAVQAARAASEQIDASATTDPAAAADVAWAASDFLAAAGRVVEGRRGGPLSDAADQYDAAARELFGRAPSPTAAGGGLRAAGRLLLAARVVKPSETAQLLALLAQLTVLVEAVTRLRETQHRAAQTAAARAAAEQLRRVQHSYASSGTAGAGLRTARHTGAARPVQQPPPAAARR